MSATQDKRQQFLDKVARFARSRRPDCEYLIELQSASYLLPLLERGHKAIAAFRIGEQVESVPLSDDMKPALFFHLDMENERCVICTSRGFLSGWGSVYCLKTDKRLCHCSC